MTLDDWIAQAAEFVDATTAREMDDFEIKMRADGATDAECLAIRLLQLATLAPERRRLLENVAAAWHSDHVVQ